MRSTARAGSGVPSRFPRALAGAKAALVLSEIASRSCSATAASSPKAIDVYTLRIDATAAASSGLPVEAT